MSIRNFLPTVLVHVALTLGSITCYAGSLWTSQPVWGVTLRAANGITVHQPRFHWGAIQRLNWFGERGIKSLWEIGQTVNGPVPVTPFEISWADDSGQQHAESVDIHVALNEHRIDRAQLTIQVGQSHVEVWLRETIERESGPALVLPDTRIYPIDKRPQ